MRTILNSTRSVIPYKPWHYTNSMYHIRSDSPQTIQDFTILGENIEFHVNMISKNGFQIPLDCDVDVEMKFTITPKTPKSETVTLK